MFTTKFKLFLGFLALIAILSFLLTGQLLLNSRLSGAESHASQALNLSGRALRTASILLTPTASPSATPTPLLKKTFVTVAPTHVK